MLPARGAGSHCEPEGLLKAASSLRAIAKQCPQSGCFAIQDNMHFLFLIFIWIATFVSLIRDDWKIGELANVSEPEGLLSSNLFHLNLDRYNKKRRKIRFLFFFKTTFLFYVSDNFSSLQRSDQVCFYFLHLRLPSQMQYQAALK